jgi:hypothetical protein
VNGVIHESFHAACYVLSLLEDDWEWVDYFNEAVVFARGSSFRRLFALALVYGGLSPSIGNLGTISGPRL